MSPQAPLAAAPRDLGSGGLGRLTWLGLAVAASGWVLLLMVIFVETKRFGFDLRAVRADGVEVARCLIGSGFGLAVIGALRTGFGALERFFAAVLSRSITRAAAPPPAAAPPIVPAPVDIAAAPVPAKRPYQILADGSVEVETIVGTRRFETMDEAREFI